MNPRNERAVRVVRRAVRGRPPARYGQGASKPGCGRPKKASGGRIKWEPSSSTVRRTRRRSTQRWVSRWPHRPRRIGLGQVAHGHEAAQRCSK
jgi:hypothetical protein